MGLLRSETKKVIDQYVKKGVLPAKSAYELLRSDTAPELIEALSEYLVIDDAVEARIWMHTINLWKGAHSDDALDTVFSKEELIFFRELLKRKGVIDRQSCLNRKIVKTPFLLRKTVQNLKALSIIDEYPLNENTFYTLSLSLYVEVRRG